MKNPFSLLIILLFPFLTLYAQTKKERVAILQFEAAGINKIECVTLTNRFRSELLKTKAFSIIERSEMDEILTEQGFQLSGCTSDECAVEAGRLLNIKQICAGNIGKVGSLYSISVRLIDVETGEILRNVTEDCQCPIERVLTHSMRNAALKLSGKMIPGTSVTVLSEGSGDIFLKTEPQGADVYIDNMQTGKTTPITLRNIAAGKHFIEVVKGKYLGSKSVTVKSNDVIHETIRLERAKGGLKVYSNPPEAEIDLDGKKYGKTPQIFKDIKSGYYTITIKKKGYADYTKKINIEPGKFINIECDLKKMASLTVYSQPSMAEVYLNENKQGITPLTISITPGKTTKIKLEKMYYEDWEETLTLLQGQKIEINATLKKQHGFIQFSIFPKSSSIKLNGKSFKSNQKEVKLPVGKYNLEINSSGYIKKKVSLNIKHNDKNKLNISLQKKTVGAALKRSIALPGWGQVYQEKSGRAWLYSIAFIGGVSGSVVFSNEYNTAVEDYNSIRELYLNSMDENDIKRLRSEIDDAYNDANSIKTTRNIFYISTSIIWLWNILDTIIIPPAWEKSVSLSANINNNVFKAGIFLNLN